MSISLTTDQERFVQRKLRIGNYRSAEEVLEIAFRLLDEYEQSNAEWVNEVRAKVDAAIEASEKMPPVDGETFVDSMLERLQQAKRK
ncbi:type II toxin-antitoxin system ParD family antitoxin [cf. Phormidesmis sp. LEGE 11477]|uniref:ribbon-helix-helix domain-containing protein n=1 Tax=cf. Phormidesmis sp. LEGE 11477 TaxID=1828680 RepID=UPI0018830C3E|nr:type II toxin-antitoxin system ParD family antitoxin [cf. Phormidesmis sp. LEGE 11477]MBE9059379.1 type II toxin-antitoxin system ParD family antitoxin [cf. Phormidesmis sp. LEGE 11477]